MSEKKCKHCAMMIPAEGKKCAYCGMYQGLSPAAKALLWIIFVLFAMGFIISLIGTSGTDNIKSQRSSKSNISKPEAAANDKFTKMTPEEHLTEAQKALNEWKLNKDPMKTLWGRVDDAKKHLIAIPQNTSESAEKEKLLKEISRREREIQKAANIAAEKIMIQQRKSFAAKYEMALLEKGMDTTITTQGKDHTILKMRWVLMSRPVIYKLINDDSFMSNLKNRGFKKVIFTDGYNSTWDPVDLTK